jgi:predicted nucleic acid-binding protein
LYLTLFLILGKSLKPTLYLETTIPSYLAARFSRDIVVMAHQELTIQWWETEKERFDIFVSEVVLEEARLGDPEAASRRLELLKELPLLEANDRTEEVTTLYMKELTLPKTAIRDAAHIAFASVYNIDYLLTWNCAHIANGEIRRKLFRINGAGGIPTPIICTPEELMKGE